jgi:uncharacterized protein YjbI with pentapeptide repeats
MNRVGNRESIVPSRRVRENASRLLIAINDYQSLGSTGAKSMPHQVARHAGLAPDSDNYRDAIDYLVKKGLLVKEVQALASYRITSDGVRVARWLRWFAPNRKRIFWTLGLVVLLAILILVGYAFDKTLWDWLELLVVPTVLVIGAFWLNRAQRQREIMIDSNREDAQRSLTQELARDAELQAYLDQMGRLMLEADLRNSRPGDDVRLVAEARTKAMLGGLIVRGGWQESFYKRGVLEFLYNARLIAKDNPFISMDDTNLVRANLNWLDLTAADMSGAHLVGAALKSTTLLDANLRNAILAEADLTGANLTGADLSGANVTDADLTDADLTGAVLYKAVGLTGKQMKACGSLKGAALPNAQKYEDWVATPDGQRWLKDKEGLGEAAGERGPS